MNNGIVKEKVKKTLGVRKYNKSTTFIKGMIDYELSLYGNDFYNLYITDSNQIKIVFKKPITRKGEHNIVSKELRVNVNFIDIVELDNYIIYTFDIPSEYKNDLNKFIKGRYSMLSEKLKTRILMTTKKKENLEKILYPTAEDRERLSKFLDYPISKTAEIYDIPDMKDELFNINNFT